MNIQLQKLFDLYELSPKDRHEFVQIYNLLPSEKQIRVVENFTSIIASIEEHKSDLYIEQEILFGQALNNIEETLRNMQGREILNQTRSSTTQLKNEL